MATEPEFSNDGPHSPDLTRAAADRISELVRYMAYATRADQGGLDLDTAYAVLGALAEAFDRLPQVITQLDAWIATEYEAGRLASAGERPLARVVADTGPALRSAGHAANSLAARLHIAQNAVSALKENDDD